MKTDHSRPILLLLLLLLLTCAALTCAQPSSNGGATDPNLAYKFNPSMLIIIFVLIAAFFFMGFFSLYIRQCAGDSDTNRGVGSRRNGLRGRSRRLRGLDAAVIETFPVLEYSVVKRLKLGKGTLECAVCLNEFEDDETLRLLPKCSHVFHPDCIDMWLTSHTTCPVCRADLVPGSEAEAEAAAVLETVDRGSVSAGEAETSSDHVAIVVDPPEQPQPQPQPEVIDPIRMPFPIPNRPIRSKSSRRPSRFPRSHSTGHSLVQPGENVERFTLRLPDNVRKEIVSATLNRTTSLVVPPAEGTSVAGGSSRGRRWFTSGGGGGEGSSRGGRAGFPFGRFDRAAKSDRWVFSMMPPFVTRTGSVKSQRRADGEASGSTKGGFGSVKSGRRADGEASGSTKGGFGSVKTPFDCLGAKGEASAEEPARVSAPVFTVSSQ